MELVEEILQVEFPEVRECLLLNDMDTCGTSPIQHWLIVDMQGEYETVAGYVFHEFGYIPRVGESITVVIPKDLPGREMEDAKKPLQQFRITIASGTARMVGTVVMERLLECDATGCDEEEPPPVLDSNEPRGYPTQAAARKGDSNGISKPISPV
jgi:hypothetical protein